MIRKISLSFSITKQGSQVDSSFKKKRKQAPPPILGDQELLIPFEASHSL